MNNGLIAVLAAIVYIGALFAIASYGDRRVQRTGASARPNLFALALSVYCTSWTFFGSVGLASHSGLGFLPIYIGPILMFTFGFPILRRIVALSKEERITSVADFLGARYGKSQAVAVVATLISVIGVIPYVALQLKAISSSISTMVPELGEDAAEALPLLGDTAFIIAVVLAIFAILFGTRHADATEHQHGMMLAVAWEAVVKLIAFLIAGIFVVFFLFGGPSELYALAVESREVQTMVSNGLVGGEWVAMTAIAFTAAILLPRQFHITVVENNSLAELERARWLFPAYLVAINIFVVPIAIAGLIAFGSSVDADLFVLELPHRADFPIVALVVFLGGLSAATAMVIVGCVALAIMISNEIVLPAYLKRKQTRQRDDMSRFILAVRRIAITVILLCSYAYYRAAGTAALASIGLLAFAAVAQLAPAFFGGLLSRRITSRGAIAGMTSGLVIWTYTLLLPTFVQAGLIGEGFLNPGPFGIAWLRPQAMFGLHLDPLSHGVFWSISVNCALMILVSLARAPEAIERLQAKIFVPSEMGPTPALKPLRTHVTYGDLKETVARYLGQERTSRSFANMEQATGRSTDLSEPVDHQAVRFAEQLLGSAIGAASSRLVMSLLLKRSDPSTREAHQLLDDATEALHYNRDLLQSVLDHMRQGIAVFDRDLALIAWNRPFRQIMHLPIEFGQVGVSLRDVLRHTARIGFLGEGDPDRLADQRMHALVSRLQPFVSRHPATDSVIRIETRRMSDGGIALTFSDVTEEVESKRALEMAKSNLERRVEERTAELTRINEALKKASAAAQEANISKTRFIAAAGHDILQPLNAARLYATALSDRTKDLPAAPLVRDLEASLDSVEEIFRAVLDLSRLDTGAITPELRPFNLRKLFDQIRVEFEPMAREKGLEFRILPTSLSVTSDPSLLGRLLRNLVSNAIKYCASGRVVVGCRRKNAMVSIEILDTGIGIPFSDQEVIYHEFRRLDAGAKVAHGLGLGLSIVQRLGRVLGAEVRLQSVVGKGTHFSVTVPLAIAVPKETNEGAPPAPPPGSVSGLTVLCIDNDDKILSGMAALLAGWGSTPLTASNMREGMALLQQERTLPDLILIDYHLDESDGLSVVTDMRWKLSRTIPAILITADRSEEVRQAAMKAGVRILNKPLKPAALRALMAQCKPAPVAAE
ncbi:hybrid sensor histidine kinase/response regulator [Afifella marina]|uniref:histidine kinase n=1 Tax=Afifella marina DSM 2698 TaxID=1120955 RepID=A0A1G5M471_AFIMA|nr:PAS domain-containing hybrid sensor histidine kinase/response regulator [Afifella marina]MBK1623002.1 hybrid sensor histidine kinase/response regulator [Afifella marina DSM 2698]MBK1625996.1 hybrid sensor histidine kinase/response regulator [Afifella marina]MBK5917820.1 hybrid sensor histidine kinase/response regulator [Afifella marina]RAI18236.1 hybrid sensor histidine kinase/response regulator [Afifella marina DSM 2698]SCZ19975.1 Na+/proline symporter [Afifella marina DSM 2698]